MSGINLNSNNYNIPKTVNKTESKATPKEQPKTKAPTSNLPKSNDNQISSTKGGTGSKSERQSITTTLDNINKDSINENINNVNDIQNNYTLSIKKIESKEFKELIDFGKLFGEK